MGELIGEQTEIPLTVRWNKPTFNPESLKEKNQNKAGDSLQAVCISRLVTLNILFGIGGHMIESQTFYAKLLRLPFGLQHFGNLQQCLPLRYHIGHQPNPHVGTPSVVRRHRCLSQLKAYCSALPVAFGMEHPVDPCGF